MPARLKVFFILSTWNGIQPVLLENSWRCFPSQPELAGLEVASMSFLDKVQQDLVASMKAQEKIRTGALRMLKSALKNAEIEAGKLDDVTAVQVIMRLCKQRRESIEIYQKNGRQETADAEKAELAIMETYLPKGLSDEELAEMVREAVKETGATHAKQMGQVMGVVMKKLAGQAVDGKKVQELVKGLLPASP